jgi:hypothetical protein
LNRDKEIERNNIKKKIEYIRFIGRQLNSINNKFMKELRQDDQENRY